MGLHLVSAQFFAGPVLAIETSCDETSASVIHGREIRSNIVSSQAELHRKWGGIVPEAAARAHVEAILPVVEEALAQASLPLAGVRGIAVTNRPGLIGALSVGVSAAKALAFALKVPMVGVHHLEGHLFSVFALDRSVPFPHMALIVSGGHTELVLAVEPGKYQIVGHTIDDAAGEAFDKAARLMGLGYPGGYAVQEQARSGDPTRYALPKGLKGDTLDFSFSGLKTAVLRLVQGEGEALSLADAAASLQHAIVEVLVERALRGAETHAVKAISLVGGVAANDALRHALSGECDRAGLEFLTPPASLCTDNAAMIGLAGSFRLGLGEQDDGTLDCLANADLPGLF